MKRILLLSSTLIFLYSCMSGPPTGVLDTEQMKAVLKDMHLADAYMSSISDSDSVKKISPAYYQLVFKKHKTDLVQFDKSLRYYSDHPALLDSIYDQILKDLKKEKPSRIKRSKLRRPPIPEQ